MLITSTLIDVFIHSMISESYYLNTFRFSMEGDKSFTGRITPGNNIQTAISVYMSHSKGYSIRPDPVPVQLPKLRNVDRGYVAACEYNVL